MSANGNRLTIVVEIPPGIDPALVDPHETAEEIVDSYNETAEVNGWQPVDFIGAEWGHHLPIP